MKLVLVLAMVGTLAGCGSSPKTQQATQSTGTASKLTPAASTPPAATKKIEQKGSAEKKAGSFDDEDISKTKPTANSGEVLGTITCVSGGDTRTIETTKDEGRACVVKYTKFNETVEKASGVEDVSKCVEVRDRIRTNLMGAGFKCD